MTTFFVLLILAPEVPTVSPRPPLSASSMEQSQESKNQSRTLALTGHNQLHLGRLTEAQANCDAALKLDVANETAKECLDLVAAMLIDQDLNNADAKLLNGDTSDAALLASKWIYTAARADQQNRAFRILRKVRPSRLTSLFTAITPEWLRQILVTILIIAGLAVLLRAVRRLWREWERGKWYGNFTSWRMFPLKEHPATPDVQTGIATDAILDALARLGHELKRELWRPKLLLLRPTPPAEYEPAIISEFLSSPLVAMKLAPGVSDLCLEWKLHDVQLDEAVQNLQIKAAAGMDVGSVARLVRSIFEWFNAGSPSISGVVTTGTDKSVSIHLTASGGRIKSIAVTASTDFAAGIDPTQLSAERAAFKFLLRMHYPGMTNDEIDGLAALRQGATQFAQYAGTVPGAEDNVQTRTSSLAKAALNLGFFRASIPLHCDPPISAQATSLEITDEVRQTVLLAEGVAHALVGSARDHLLAIDCFRQLQDWPASAQTAPLRQQASYNEAVVWRQTGYPGRCVLMLTELLGERAPDTLPSAHDVASQLLGPKPELPRAIRFPARVARLTAFAQYQRDDWTALPESRATLLIDDAEKLVEELNQLRKEDSLSAHDLRLTNYMYIEALRAIGHVELLRVISGPGSPLYKNGRPLGLKDGILDKDGIARLHRAIPWMLTCEQLAPSCGLFCDLAEAYLLLKDFRAAEGYARHATLESNAYNERAYYLAAESFFLANADGSMALARKYVSDFKGPVTMDEFKSLCEDLGLGETAQASRAAVASASVSVEQTISGNS